MQDVVVPIFQAFEAIDTVLFSRSGMGYFGSPRLDAAPMGGHNQHAGTSLMEVDLIIRSFLLTFPKLPVVFIVCHYVLFNYIGADYADYTVIFCSLVPTLQRGNA